MVGCVGYLLLKMYAQLKHPTSVDCWACQTIVVTVISIISSVLLRWKHSYPSIKFTENSANSVIIHAFNMLMCSFMAIFQPYSSFIMEFAFIIFYILNPTFFDADFRHAHTHTFRLISLSFRAHYLAQAKHFQSMQITLETHLHLRLFTCRNVSKHVVVLVCVFDWNISFWQLKWLQFVSIMGH